VKPGFARNCYCSLAYSALASFGSGTSGSASAGDLLGWLYEGIVTDCKPAVLQNQIACSETGVYLQKRLSQGNGLDLFGRLVNCDPWPRKPGSLILLVLS
jgi:hypothetical protein